MANKEAIARSTRRKYRRVKDKLAKDVKGLTLGQAKQKFSKEYGEDVIIRHFQIMDKKSSPKAGKAVKSSGRPIRPAPKPVGKMKRKPKSTPKPAEVPEF